MLILPPAAASGLLIQLRLKFESNHSHDRVSCGSTSNSSPSTIAVSRPFVCGMIAVAPTPSGIPEGPLFRPRGEGRTARRATAHRQKRLRPRQGLAGSDQGRCGNHSLRAGFLTSAARRGVSVFKMHDVDSRRRRTRAGQTRAASPRSRSRAGAVNRTWRCRPDRTPQPRRRS
jgi:hypothetical protein